MSTARAVSAILTDAGLTEHDGRVVSQLVDLSTRYVQDVIEDARRMKDICKHSHITDDDVAYGIKVNNERTKVQEPPQQLMQELANEINSEPLPAINQTGGLRLPADRHLLTAPNGQIPNRDDLSQLSGGVSNLVPPTTTAHEPTHAQQQMAQHSFQLQHMGVDERLVEEKRQRLEDGEEMEYD